MFDVIDDHALLYNYIILIYCPLIFVISWLIRNDILLISFISARCNNIVGEGGGRGSTIYYRFYLINIKSVDLLWYLFVMWPYCKEIIRWRDRSNTTTQYFVRNVSLDCAYVLIDGSFHLKWYWYKKVLYTCVESKPYT